MASKSFDFSVLQVDPRLVSVLLVERSAEGVAAVEFIQEKGDWSNDQAELATALEELVKVHELAERPVYTVLPRHEITTRILELPSNDPDEIANMIQLSAPEYVPFSEQELVVDQSVLRKQRDGTSRVLAAFAHKPTVEAHVKLLGDAGVVPERIFLSTACLSSAVLAARQDTPDRFGLANLGAGGLEVCMFGSEGLEYVRGVATVQDWSLETQAGSEAVEELAIELRASLSTYKRDSPEGLGADEVYLASDWADPKPISDAVLHELTTPCEPSPFETRLTRGKSERLPLVLLGAALTAQERGKASISLVPPSLKKARAKAESRRTLVRIGAVVGAIVLAAAAAFVQVSWQRQQYIADLEARIAAIEPEYRATMNKQRGLQILHNQVGESATALELLAHIAGITPSGINITLFRYIEGSSITIEGRALNETLPARLNEVIRQASAQYPVLANPVVTGTRQVKEYNKTVYEFQVEVPFPVEEEDATPEDEEGAVT